MAPYADYGFYIGTYSGDKLDEATFNRLAIKASSLINTYTFGRAATFIELGDVPETNDLIKMAVCALADEMYAHEQQGTNRGLIQSETVGRYSVTYTAGAAMSDDRKLYNIIYEYLAASGLMYSGI